mmetsp:Transcript_117291/g.331892  ORF Transcript_117291/g.331892 Transcript_117291/m.331892 type:complete len:202 (+) Transcript_117291:395-1000(+)
MNPGNRAPGGCPASTRACPPATAPWSRWRGTGSTARQRTCKQRGQGRACTGRCRGSSPKKHTNRSTPPKTTQLQAPRVATKRFVQKPWKMIMLRPATKKTLPISEPSNPYTSWQYMGNSPAKAPNDTICRSCARKTKPKLRSARMSLTICVSVPMPSAGFALPLCLVSKSGATVMVGALSGSEAEPITKFNNVKAAATKAT